MADDEAALLTMICCLQHDDRETNDDWRGPRLRGRGGFTRAARGRGSDRGFSRGGAFGRSSFDSRRRPPFRSRSPFSGGGG